MNVIESAKAGGLDAKTMDLSDRSWVVAGLALEGVTAEETAKLLSCSLRLVRQIRADPMTAIARYAFSLHVDMERAKRAAKADKRDLQFQLADATANAARYKDQRDQLLETRQAATV